MRGERSAQARSLLPAIVDGDEQAWSTFAALTWDDVESQMRRGRILGPYRDSPDDCREVASLVFARLHRDGFRALSLFASWHRRHPEKDFHDWLAIVSANVARDYMTRRLSAEKLDEKNLLRLAETLSDSADDRRVHASFRPPITNQVAAMRLLDRARLCLRGEQYEVLVSWLRGHDFEDIARAHGLGTASEAQGRVRAALARLRYAMRGSE